MGLLDSVGSVLSSVWGLFTGVTVPGTDFSFGSLFLGVLLIRISLAIMQHGLGFGGGSGYRSGSTNRPKISKDRKGDTH